MNLTIDKGNTRTKVAVFDNNKMVFFETVEKLSIELLKNILDNFNIDYSIISSVSVEEQEAQLFLEKNTTLIDFSTNTPINLKIDYQTPHTLGKDRIAAAIGALEAMPNSNVLVVDMGSCVTYDVVEKERIFCGGNIAPGFRMRLSSMHSNTANLPELELQKPISFIGKSTNEAILNGAFWGIVYEIDSIYQKLLPNYPELKVVLAGGDAHYFAETIKTCNFVDKNLVSTGLNKIIENVVNKSKKI